MLCVLYVILTWKVFFTGGQTVSFGLDRNQATCKEPLMLGCYISPFISSDAIWNRNGAFMTQCGDIGFCSVPSKIIGGTTYTFSGNGSGIFVSVASLPNEEHGVNWSCIHSGTPHIYTLSVTCPASSSSDVSGGLSIGAQAGTGIAVSVAVIVLIIVIIIICVPPNMSLDLQLTVEEKKGDIIHTLIWSPAKKMCWGNVTYVIERAEIDASPTVHNFSKFKSHIKKCCQQINTSTPNLGYMFRVKAKGLLVCSHPTNTARLDTITVEKKATVGEDVRLLETELKNQLDIKHVKWYFNETAVEANVLKYELGKPDAPVLLIHELTARDAGFYNCKIIIHGGSYKNYVVKLEVIESGMFTNL